MRVVRVKGRNNASLAYKAMASNTWGCTVRNLADVDLECLERMKRTSTIHTECVRRSTTLKVPSRGGMRAYKKSDHCSKNQTALLIQSAKLYQSLGVRDLEFESITVEGRDISRLVRKGDPKEHRSSPGNCHL